MFQATTQNIIEHSLAGVELGITGARFMILPKQNHNHQQKEGEDTAKSKQAARWLFAHRQLEYADYSHDTHHNSHRKYCQHITLLRSLRQVLL